MRGAVVFAALVGVAQGAKVTPVQKVIELMNGMLAKGKKEKHEEQVKFAAYKQFCEDTKVDKERAIEEAEDAIAKLKADIEKFTSDGKALAKSIEKLQADVAVWTGDQKSATKVRNIEKEDYRKTHTDYSESVDALERAIATLKKQDKKTPQAAMMLLQLDPIIPEADKHIVKSYLDRDEEISLLDDSQAPQAAGYEFQSGGVIEMLQKLLDKFSDEKADLEKGEVNAAHAFDLLMSDLKSEIEHANKAIDEKSSARGKKLQHKASAQGDLQDTEKMMKEDKAYLSDLVASCEQKANDFESRQNLRAEELEAIQKAIDIVGGDSVKGASEEHLPQLTQMDGTSFMQISSKTNLQAFEANISLKKMSDFLRNRGDKIHSRILVQISEMAGLGSGASPFKKITKLIQDLIQKLMQEAAEEAEKKGWCDTELTKNEATRTEKSDTVVSLTADIDGLSASIAKLTEDIENLSKAVSKLDETLATATKLRLEAKDKAEKTISDAKEAQVAVASALTVLNEFYAKAAKAEAFMQTSQEPPETFDKPYTGMGKGGVVGMLEVIQSDFARLETETATQEVQEQQEYDKLKTDTKVDKAAKETDIEHKTAKKQDQSQSLEEKKGDLEGTQKELNAANDTFDKLKPQCIDTGPSYEEKVAQREAEIQSLQEALQILQDQ